MSRKPSQSDIRGDRIFNVSLMIFCQSFQAIAIGGIALFLPLIREDLGMSFSQGGTLAAVSTLVYALMQIPSGYLADRFGGKRLFAIGIFGTTLMSLLFGLSGQYWQALLVQGFSGFFRALVFAPGIRLLTGWFPPEKRAMAMGLALVGGFAGNIFLDIVGPLMVATRDWRFPFIILPPFGILASLVLWRLGKEPPAKASVQKANIRDIVHFFRSRLMWTCGVIQYVRLAVMMGTAFWLPSLLIDEKGLSLQLTGLLIALRAALTAPSNLVGGYISDRLRNPIAVIAVSLAVLMVTTVLLVLVDDFVLLLVVLAVNSIFVQMYFGPLFSVPVEVMGERVSGTSTGFSNLFANIGAFTFVALLGILKDASGSFLSGFVTIGFACLVGLAFTFILGRMRCKALETNMKEV